MPSNDWTVGQEWSAVREHCAAHTQAVLSDDTIATMYLEAFDELALRMQLTDRPLLREHKESVITDQDSPLSAIEANAIINGVSRRPVGSTSENDWRDVPIISIDDLDVDLYNHVVSVAIYDTPPRALFTYDPADYEHRIVFIRTLTRPTLKDQPPEINTCAATLRVLLTSEKCLPICLKNDKEAYDAQTYEALLRPIERGIDQKWDELFERLIRNEPQRGPMQRPRRDAGRSPHVSRTGIVTAKDI